MRFASLLAGAVLGLATSSQAINILLNNDDGFGSGNLRELYRILKDKGHNGKFHASAFSAIVVHRRLNGSSHNSEY